MAHALLEDQSDFIKVRERTYHVLTSHIANRRSWYSPLTTDLTGPIIQ